MQFKIKIFLATILFTINSFTIIQAQNAVLPGKEQVAWADAEIGVIIHLDINIYAPDSFDYKNPKTLPDINAFNPSRLNTDQWLKTAKAAGAKYALLTVKHGTGFCLWPSKVNNYNVGHTKWRNGRADILKEFIASCKKYDIKPGLYYNTNSNTYYDAGNKPFLNDSLHIAYNKAVLAQLTELWSNYGSMFEIWFDGGITNDKKLGLEKDIVQLIRTKQPQAILFQGPVTVKNIIRWIGNEDGIAAYPQWSRANATTSSNGLVKIEALHGEPDGKVWCPGESDFPIRKNNAWNGGWLWKANEESYLFTVNELKDKYYKSVGRNTNMLIGMVVDTNGLIPKKDSLVFDSLGKHISRIFSKPVAIRTHAGTRTTTLNLAREQKISKAIFEEDISKGENIRAYSLQALVNKKWTILSIGQSVGHKRIELFSPVITNKVRLIVATAAGKISLRKFAVFE